MSTEPSTIDGEAEEILEGAIQAAGAVAVRERGTAIVARDEISVEDLVAQNQKIHEAMSAAMREDHHYGKIPGVAKPTLLKPGAEKLCVLFRLAPSYQSERIFHDDGHLTVIATCTLTHIPTGLVVSSGEALCTSKETRYAYRNAERTCPDCGEPQVRKGKARGNQPGNWYCWRKQGGCGATWPLDGEQARLFEAMETGKVDNPELADTFNTVLKMADKRALVAAVLNGTAASDVFTQDAEDSAPGFDQPSGSGATGAERASAAGAEHTASVDPGLVLPDGFKGEGVVERIGETLKAVDSTVDWRATWDAAIMALYQKSRADLENHDELWTRLAVVADRLHPFTQTLPPTDAQIAEAFAYAFQGVTIDVVQAPQQPSGASTSAQSDADASGQGEDTPEAQKASDAALSPAGQAQAAAAADDDIPFMPTIY